MHLTVEKRKCQTAFLLAAFLESGMEPGQVKKILGENAIAFFRRILP